MQLRYAVAIALMTMSVSSTNVTSMNNLNGWYPCSEHTFSNGEIPTGSVAQDAECAVYSAPLCYPGICETPEDVNPNVDIFVKRLPASVGNPGAASNVWLLQGGPGASSTGLEGLMVALHSKLEGAVNVYLMDHRGTGRSTLLDYKPPLLGPLSVLKLIRRKYPSARKTFKSNMGTLLPFL
ncbi:Serine protease [Phytophthora megakarya]|uniref:Serine protease n=1 Tax=Phytophthora megakarya TaxID=4795 RepID=A0A225VHJ4_9STRA|nr:Serine protease [Phytophthora megakarya]